MLKSLEEISTTGFSPRRSKVKQSSFMQLEKYKRVI